jgi:hypothetical protein
VWRKICTRGEASKTACSLRICLLEPFTQNVHLISVAEEDENTKSTVSTVSTQKSSRSPFSFKNKPLHMPQ